MYRDSDFFKNVVALTSIKLCKRPYLEQIERICNCYPKAMILREKDLSEQEYSKLAKSVLKICKQHHICCILHTYIDVAIKMNCTKIHLPLPLLQEHQAQLKRFKIVGTSVHSVEEAQLATKLGANYIIAGHIYETECKKGVAPRGVTFLKEVCNSTSLPVYAIGGIKLNKEQIDEVMYYGAKGACIMSSMMRI